MKTNTSHTPGPWLVSEPDHVTNCLICRVGEIAVSSAPVNSGTVGSEMANARLIAAAPELLEALETAAAAVYEFTRSALIDAGHSRGRNGSAGKIALENPVYIQARLAIAKAQGGAA